MVRISLVTAAAFALWCALPAAAFTFSDGTKGVCTVGGVEVVEVDASPEDASMVRRTGRATRVGNGWQITWNQERLKAFAPDLRDFLFFHECAHARVPTEVELEANCAGLIDMRLSGRATPSFETRFRAIVGNAPYWSDTFECADKWAERERAKQPAGVKQPAGAK